MEYLEKCRELEKQAEEERAEQVVAILQDELAFVRYAEQNGTSLEEIDAKEEQLRQMKRQAGKGARRTCKK